MRRENWEGHGFTGCRKIRVETGLDPFSDCPIIFVRGGFGKGRSLEGAEKLTWFLAKGALEAGMRGNEDRQEEVFSYIPLEKRVGAEHPLRRLRAMADRALSELGAWFDRLYSQTGRPSIPPEQLLRALILQALYTIRSERQLMDQIDGNWRYRWFVGLKLDEPV